MRFIARYYGTANIDAEYVRSQLPETARFIEEFMPGFFLIEASSEAEIEQVLLPSRDWHVYRERFILWHRGTPDIDADEVMSRLSGTTARLIHCQMPNLFLVEAETESELRNALVPPDVLTIARYQFGHAL